MTISPAALLDTLHWRYATKAFDPSRRIDAATWAALEESLVLTPSSFGLQPWRFLVVTDPAVKARLKPVSWNQAQVVDCSHLVVLAAKTAVSEADIDAWIARICAVRGSTPAQLAGYRQMMIDKVVKGGLPVAPLEWATRQCYIALGQFMLAAASVGVDTCPMEGIEPARYDEILGLTGSGFATCVACPAGHRAAGDKYAGLAKVRYPAASVIVGR